MTTNAATVSAVQAPVTTGRDLIMAAQARRQAAESYADLAKELSDLPVEDLEVNDPNYVQGVLIKYSPNRVVDRYQTAFEYALKTAEHRQKHGQLLSDSSIIYDFYRAYGIAAAHAQDGRPSELPSLKELTRTARNIRYYVYGLKHNKSVATLSIDQAGASPGRKALQTFGKRGGTTTSQRRIANPDRPDAKTLRDGWARANKRREAFAQMRRLEVLAWVMGELADTGTSPSHQDIMKEFGLSKSTVRRYLRALEVI